MDQTASSGRVAAVAIGRNEGARLLACLDSLARQVSRVVYVDSGSTDGSREAAAMRGAIVETLDMSRPFTAARARNAGVARLLSECDAVGEPAPEFIQFIDGDCIMDPDWIATARAFMIDRPVAAVACGRLRERFPEASIYNRMCNREWDTPVGLAKACGGIAMMRLSAFEAAGGFDPRLIAGEEPELCLRMRTVGWEIHRIDAEMALHDADMHHFGQWWTRMRRAGYAWAEGAAIHGATPERYNVSGLMRAVVWGIALPTFVLAMAALIHPAFLALGLAWPLQVVRLARRGGWGRDAWETAIFFTLGKFAEAQGVLRYVFARLLRRPATIIEYRASKKAGDGLEVARK
ncbi:glycosyltransferase [Albimonas sp. CAU 1670]|uniref:glycosyltransferase family 2 protein n=1 Tax=Albimonas sp. CAU 1670 TaxID=3032599 RepID=UPI0023DCD15F|nr:glycosyltransferase [Albimonas sp. CAU 1670]MDF2231630.1 glycosyltransferase [Albimonas sp. CAU 1670]